MQPQLVKIDVAAAHLGWSAAKLFDLLDGGTLLEKGFTWTFNLAHDRAGERRDPRFWLPEIQARRVPSRLPETLDAVLEMILPPKRANFHAGEVDQLLQIRPRTRIDLHAEIAGRLEGGRHFYSRAALAAFLRRRWLGQTFAVKETRTHQQGALRRMPASTSPH